MDNIQVTNVLPKRLKRNWTKNIVRIKNIRWSKLVTDQHTVNYKTRRGRQSVRC